MLSNKHKETLGFTLLRRGQNSWQMKTTVASIISDGRNLECDFGEEEFRMKTRAVLGNPTRASDGSPSSAPPAPVISSQPNRPPEDAGQ